MLTADGGAPIDDASVVCLLSGESHPSPVSSPTPGRYACDGPAGTYSLEVTWRGSVVVSRMVSVPEAGRCGGAETVSLVLSVSPPSADGGAAGDAGSLDAGRD